MRTSTLRCRLLSSLNKVISSSERVTRVFSQGLQMIGMKGPDLSETKTMYPSCDELILAQCIYIHAGKAQSITNPFFS